MLGVYYLYRPAPIPASLFIAAGITIKLFSILLVPYLLWTRRFRAFAWTICFLVFFWVLLPVAVFGFKGTVDVYSDWLHVLQRASDFSVERAHPVLISLARSANHLFPSHPGQAALLVNAFRVMWTALLLSVFIYARKHRPSETSAFMLLSDVGVLILAPIAISPSLEPYHPVAIAIPGLLLLTAAADSNQERRNRAVAIIFFAAAFVIFAVPSSWEIRGLIVNLKLLFATLGTVTIVLLGKKSQIEEDRAELDAA